MRLKCVKSLDVAGRTVFVEGHTYDFEDKGDKYEVRTYQGYGVFSKNEPILKEYFREEPAYVEEPAWSQSEEEEVEEEYNPEYIPVYHEKVEEKKHHEKLFGAVAKAEEKKPVPAYKLSNRPKKTEEKKKGLLESINSIWK